MNNINIWKILIFFLIISIIFGIKKLKKIISKNFRK